MVLMTERLTQLHFCVYQYSDFGVTCRFKRCVTFRDLIRVCLRDVK